MGSFPDKKSVYIQEAFEIIQSVAGKPKSVSERKKTALDLAEALLHESMRVQTHAEKIVQNKLARMMKDPIGKAFTTSMTDECFRSKNHKRIADQIIHLIQQFGIPRYLPALDKIKLYFFLLLGKPFSFVFVPLATYILRRQTSKVILPGEYELLLKHLEKRKAEGVRLNLNHLGEAVLSEEEAQRRLNIYLEDLEQEAIDYVSIKISTIFSQINLLAWDYSLEPATKRLRMLYRKAIENPFINKNGEKQAKFVNLDMEEYKDLHLTVEAFKKVLSEKEFHEYSAGIVLQAYLPDSHSIQKELTEWAKKRVRNGGAPIKIRLVKGANLANEQFESSVKNWPQAPYTCKVDVDTNYKKMLIYGCAPENAEAVHLGIASHNLFDISFTILLRAENRVEAYANFEMLEGMADHIRRTVQKVTGEILLYCPVATKDDFQHAIAYLIRRLDENTGAENFLRHIFELHPGSNTWEEQVALFSRSCDEIETVAQTPRKSQNRNKPEEKITSHLLFENEADTDFSLPANRKWAEEIVAKWKDYKPGVIPLCIAGKEVQNHEEGNGYNPSSPKKPWFRFSLGNTRHIDDALECAKKYEKFWSETPVEKRCDLLHKVARKFRQKRGDLIGASMLNGGKILAEADPEVSEAIDMAEYYLHQMQHLTSFKDIKLTAKGTVLVAPPWNFPVAIPAGGVLASLVSGNCTLFKPAPEAVLTGWLVAQTIWEAMEELDIPRQVLQFINCCDHPVGDELIKDKRVDMVVLTGATSTAKLFIKMRPDIDLIAETGGKNAMIISALCDRDLAIKDLLHSAFSHQGQKCSAASLAILQAEVYDDLHFRKQLKEAAASLVVGAAWDLSSKIAPLIHEPEEALLRALTTLEKGEKWLLKPKQDPDNPWLWSPGIKLGVKLGSFTQQTELFGPVLGLIRAKNIDHAIDIANSTCYGLSAGLHSLDQREQVKWRARIEAGNCYINRTMTGAIVRRQPFGGCKSSSFGSGAKAGGPNFLREFFHKEQISLPREKQPVNEWVNSLAHFIEKLELTAEELGNWYASIANYAYWWKRMECDRDLTKLVGQDNFLRYVPGKNIVLRIEKDTNPFDALRICAAALSCSSDMEISWNSKEKEADGLNWHDLIPVLRVVDEEEASFLKRVETGSIRRVRLTSRPSDQLLKAASHTGCHIADDAVLANGRFELLHYVRQVSTSIDYHRYGNLGIREGELRKPIL